ncbi:MAG TPA: FAD-linked oxidase C-terminal domain-containing protein [Bryobacteraceae bacterium]|nr:FAD-linked oxidase C-terminal domain-containing protein [Bryobacteraceae bacterium]
MIPSGARQRLVEAVGPRGYLDRAEDLRLYEYDGGVDKARPEVVLFPKSAEAVSAIMKIAASNKIPLLGRGAGTGLSGGSVAVAGGLMVSFSRMHRILEIDLENERAVVEPGVVNLDLTAAVQGDGYFFAPDPSSQKACTIGGNVAENAGGPHTLAYGVTVNHVLGLEMVMPDGRIVQTGAGGFDTPGYDLPGVLTGSEGTLGLVTKVTVRLMRKPEAVKTFLAIYDTEDDCALTVSEITARGITPAALEMLDGTLMRMVEESTHAGYPLDAAGVLLIELEGLTEAVEEQAGHIQAACKACRAREVREARSAAERELLWKGRKNAFGAVGRVSPFYYVHDGVVPRTQIAPTLRLINKISKKRELTISNIFHAGDGNLHPLILFDARKPGDMEAAQSAGFDILEHCIKVGGSITGEHGIGVEKIALMDKQFRQEALEVMRKIKSMCDPSGLMNPGKVLPARKGCAEITQPPIHNPEDLL